MGRYQYSGGLSCCVSNCSAKNRSKNKKTNTKIFSTRYRDKILTFCLKHLRDYQARKRARIPLPNDSPNDNRKVADCPEQMKPTSQKVNLDHNYFFQQDDRNKLQNLLRYVHYLELKIGENKVNNSPNSNQATINNPHFLSFYTGFSDIITYKSFTSLIIKHAVAYKKMYLRKDNHNLGLEYENQIFIVLARLRLGLLEEDIAYRYNISQSTVSRIFRFWINVMYSYFIQIPIWPSREIVKKYMPQCFINRYPSTRVILDGTEIFIEKPSDYAVQSSTYSVYKAHNTARGIIGVTPNGFVCFVSELYPGRTSEKEIILNSGLLEKLEPGDSVMADKGFTISKELAAIDVDLNIPPFSYGNNQQFTDSDEILTRDIASVRVHVERVLRNVKLNRIMRSSIPNTMADQLNQIWVVCCYLTNFRKKPLLDIKTEKKSKKRKL